MWSEVKLYGTATVGTKGQIVIPAEARQELRIKEGDKVIVVRAPHGEGIVVLKADLFEELLGKMQTKLGTIASSIKDLEQPDTSVPKSK